MTFWVVCGLLVLTALAFVIGILLVPLGVETRGKPLPP